MRSLLGAPFRGADFTKAIVAGAKLSDDAADYARRAGAILIP